MPSINNANTNFMSCIIKQLMFTFHSNYELQYFCWGGGTRGVYIQIVKGHGIYNICFSTLLGGGCPPPKQHPWLWINFLIFRMEWFRATCFASHLYLTLIVTSLWSFILFIISLCAIYWCFNTCSSTKQLCILARYIWNLPSFHSKQICSLWNRIEKHQG